MEVAYATSMECNYIKTHTTALVMCNHEGPRKRRRPQGATMLNPRQVPEGHAAWGTSPKKTAPVGRDENTVIIAFNLS